MPIPSNEVVTATISFSVLHAAYNKLLSTVQTEENFGCSPLLVSQKLTVMLWKPLSVYCFRLNIVLVHYQTFLHVFDSGLNRKIKFFYFLFCQYFRRYLSNIQIHETAFIYNCDVRMSSTRVNNSIPEMDLLCVNLFLDDWEFVHRWVQSNLGQIWFSILTIEIMKHVQTTIKTPLRRSLADHYILAERILLYRRCTLYMFLGSCIRDFSGFRIKSLARLQTYIK